MNQDVTSSCGVNEGVSLSSSSAILLYCDYNATTPLADELQTEVYKAYTEHWCNLSSNYLLSKNESSWIKRLRGRLNAISGDPSDVVFCGSSTEAINQIVFSLSALDDECEFATTNLEHPSVRNAISQWLKRDVLVLSAKHLVEGDFTELDSFASSKSGLKVIIIQAVNNETGILLPIEEMRRRLPQDTKIVVDATQAFGKCDNFIELLQVADAFVLSPHKFFGPKGLGILVWKKRLGTLKPFIVGGSQEHGLRSGTENTPVIYLASKWLELVPKLMAHNSSVKEYRVSFERGVTSCFPKAQILGAQFERVNNTSSIYFPDVPSDSLVAALDSIGIMTSSGSACSSGTREPSKTFLALGLSWEEARCVVRFSFGYPNLDFPVHRLVNHVVEAVRKLG